MVAHGNIDKEASDAELGLRLIRETVGPQTFIEGCPAGTPLNGIGYFNSYFTGHDVYNSWQGMYALFSSISANAFLNHMDLCDARRGYRGWTADEC